MLLRRARKLAAPCVHQCHLYAAQRQLSTPGRHYYNPLQHRLQEVLTAIGASEQWDEVLPALAAARAAGIKPNLYNYSKAISLLTRAKQFDAAVQQLRQMQQERTKPDVVVVNSLLHACR